MEGEKWKAGEVVNVKVKVNGKPKVKMNGNPTLLWVFRRFFGEFGHLVVIRPEVEIVRGKMLEDRS